MTLFAGDAWEAIFEATDGVPRLVNQLCDRALVEAIAAGRTQIDRHIIQAAWADIQQLPTPWETPAPTTAAAAPLQVVEFGNLAKTIERTQCTISESSHRRHVRRAGEDELLVAEPTELDDEDDEVVIAPATAKPSPRRSRPTSQKLQPTRLPKSSTKKKSCSTTSRLGRHVPPRYAAGAESPRSRICGAGSSRDSTADVCEQIVAAPTGAAFRMLEAGLDDYEISTMDLLPADPGDCSIAGATDWPPLRLAMIPEPARPSPRSNPTNSSRRNAWSRSDAPHWNDAAGSMTAEDEDPVLIVEDDDPSPQAPVRREEYRNLFSRLRSG